MSSRNDNSGEMMGIAIVVTMLAFAFLFVYAILLFIAFVLTILAVLAWNNPLTIGSYTVEPREARLFVKRGLIGMVGLPVFAAFCQALFSFQIEETIWPHLFLGGYVLGSIVLEMMAEENQQETIHSPSPPQMPAPQEPPRPLPPAEPFRFASWDDEEREE